MKKIMIVILCCLFASNLFAQNAVTFTARSFWEKPDFDYNGSFSSLEQLGVMKSAEQNAMSKCFQAGYSNCCVVESRIVTCNGWNGQLTCEGSATVRGVR